MDAIRAAGNININCNGSNGGGGGSNGHNGGAGGSPQQSPSLHVKSKDGNAGGTRNGLGQSPSAIGSPGGGLPTGCSSARKCSSDSGGGGPPPQPAPHQQQCSSDSGNSSCVSSSGGGASGPDDPETKNRIGGDSFGDSDGGGHHGPAAALKKNIYVNQFFDEGYDGDRVIERGHDDGLDSEQEEEEAAEAARRRRCRDSASDAEDVKPLLQLRLDNERNRKPAKSIVKSPSNASFGEQRQRLNLQFTQPEGGGATVERPVLHVQFSKQANGFCVQDAGGHSVPAAPGGLVCSSPGGSILSHGSSSSSSSTSSSSSSSNGNSSLAAYAEARPPDGGWGWVVCFASFMVNLIADGVTFSFGVLYIELLAYFGEGKGKTAWVGSLFMAMPLLCGPVASFLTDRYGCRNVTVVGSILASIGFALSAYANSIEMLYLTFGILAGFGLSLCYVAAVVIVAYYFDKRRSFATGLSVCGSGIGTFLFAWLTQVLLDSYGWRGTTLILAGIFLNMCLCGLLMRDLEWTTHKSKQKRRKQQQQQSRETDSASNSTNTAGTVSNLNAPDGGPVSGSNAGGNPMMANGDIVDPNDPRLFSSLITLPTFLERGVEKLPPEVLETLTKHRNVHEHILNYPSLLHSRSFSQPLTPQSGGDVSPQKPPSGKKSRSPLVAADMADDEASVDALEQGRVRRGKAAGNGTYDREHPFLRRVHSHSTRGAPTAYLKDLRMHRHSLTYRGAMLNIQRYRLRASSCPDIYRNSMTTIAKEKSAWCQGMEEFRTLLVSILDFSYFSDIHFLLFAISNFLLYTFYDVPYVYLGDNASELGFSHVQSSRLISVIGILNMVGEIVLGWMGDRKSVNANFTYAVCMGLCGLVTALVPLFTDYTSLLFLSGGFGLFIAANYSLTSIILVELITLERFTNAYGLLLLVQGVANLVGPPLAGWISDLTKSYDLSFYLAGFFIAISGVLLLILPAVGKVKKLNSKRQASREKTAPYDCYRMANLTQLSTGLNNNSTGKAIGSGDVPNATKPSNGTAILVDCFGQEKLLKDGSNV